MQSSSTLIDGNLGYVPSAGAKLYCLGPATGGSTTVPVSFGDPGSLYSTYTSGKLPDRLACHFANRGPGPVVALRCAASTAGTLPSYDGAIATALAGNAGNSFAGISFTGPRNVEVTFGAAWDGGNILITGTDAADAAQTETITAAAGSTVKGVKVFKTISAIAKGAVGASANTAAPKYGNKTAAASGSDAKCVLSGTPIDDVDLLAVITRGGAVGGTPSPAAKVSPDGGLTFGAETALSGGGAISGYGVTFTFTGSALKANDAFGQKGTGPAATTNDLSAGLAVLSTIPGDGGDLHILGALTGAQAAVVLSWKTTEEAAGRIWVAHMEVRDYNAGESDADWQTAILADWAGVTDTTGAALRWDGHYPTVIPGGRGIQRRSAAWTAVTQMIRVGLQNHPSSKRDGGGPLLGLYTPTDSVTPPACHDERLSPGMGGSTGRGATLQTLPGEENRGLWFAGDAAGLRSPGTLAGGTSDFSLVMNARIAAQARRILQASHAGLLAQRVGLKTDKTLLESEAKRLDGESSRALTAGLGEAVQSARVVWSRTEQVKTSKRGVYTAYLRVFGYLLKIDAFVALE